jgi:4-phosphopantoate--beta-alanine ligase
VAALVPEATVELSEVSGAPLEVNLFYRTRKRELAVRDALLAAGATAVLGLGPKTATIPELFSERRIVDPEGIYKADVVVVPLEDGDRTEALKRIGKFVITIDLNPLSRTAQTADITIVDNITRAIPNIVSAIRELRQCGAGTQMSVARGFDNRRSLSEALIFIRDRLTALAGGRG